MTLTARPRFLIRFAALAALALCGIVLALSSTGTPPVGAQDGSLPAKPTGVVATATHDSVSLAWDDPVDASITHYQIFRRDRDVHDTGEFVTIEDDTGSAAASYTDDTVEPETRYVYRVKAVNQHGASTWSDFVRADTPAAPDPADLAPSGLEVSLVENRVTLTWDAPASDAASVTGYEILRRRPNDGEAALTTLVADTGNAETGYTDDSANEPGVRYTYRVRALRDGEQSKVSNYARIDLPDDYAQDTPEPEEEPSPEALAPSGLTAAVEDGGVALSWTAPAEDAGSVTGYEVLRAQGSAELATLEADTGNTDTTYTDSGVTGDLDGYRYQVKALRGGDASQGSNVAGVLQSAHAGAIIPLADVTLISNLDQSRAGGGVFTNDQAQAFTTGSNSGGYSLTKVVIESSLRDDADFTVSVHENDSGAPGTSLGTLTKPTLPATDTTADYEFTHSGIDLAASTTYFIVVDVSTSNGLFTIWNTNSDAEDTGGATGWSIGDSSLYRGFGSTGSWTTWAESKKISVTGTVKGGTTNSDATGAPVITGTPAVGELLTADISNIGDADGIADADFEYQWIAFDGTTDSDISGATGETYRPLLAHLGQTIKVRVTFDDDDDNAESVTSAATAAVTASTYGQVIWAATLTVEEETVAAGTFFGFSLISDRGSLEPYTFTHDGNSTFVSILQYLEGGLLRFTLSGNLGSADFNLYLDGAPFLIESPGTDTFLTFSDHGLTWTDEQEVEVRLTVNRPATGAPAITGKPEVGETLTAGISGIMDEDGLPAAAQFAYQWISNDGTDDSDIDGATDSTYTLVEADAGKSIKVRVSFTDDAKFPEFLTSAAVTVPVAALVSNVGQTAATGDAQVNTPQSQGQGFTTGSDSGGYTLGSVELAVSSFSGTASDITVSIYSESSGDPGTVVHTLTTPASISAAVTTFTAPSGATLAASTTYYVVISTTSSGISLSRTDATAEDTGGVSGWSIADSRRFFGLSGWNTTTNPIRMRVNGDAATSTNSPATGAPTITGTPEVGELLTADISNIGDSDGIADADFEYQWIAFDGTTDSDISGATGETYRPLLAHLGQTIKVRVSFDDDDGSAESLTSAPTAAVTASTYGQVIWAATLTVEEETVAAGTFFGYSIGGRGSLEPNSFTHDGNSTIVTALQYLESQLRFFLSGHPLGSEDFNLYLDAAPFLIESPGTDIGLSFEDHGLTWTDEQEVEVRLTVNRPATGAPAITGKPEVGETLTAGISGIMDDDGLPVLGELTYQWISDDGTDDSDIDGATDSTYTLVQADAGKTIKVRVSFTDNAKFPEFLTSAATTAVTVPVAALVSNVGQTAAGNANVTATQSQGQGFTTGSDSGGYTLGSVELAVSSFSGTASDITVSIYSESSGDPGTLVHTLTTPASIATPVTTFTAPSGTTLAANTTYYVVISTTGSGINLSRTNAAAEDTGGASGWSIADDRRFIGGGTWVTTSSPIRMRVNGAAATTTTTAIWSATLTVAELTTDPDTYLGYSQIGSGTGDLDPSTFSHDGDEITVFSLWYIVGGVLIFQTSQELGGEGFLLRLGETLLPLGEPTGSPPKYEFSDHGLSWSDGDTVEVRLIPNQAATGAPVITGTPEVGETLTADTSGIGDPDGIDNADFEYQWIANDGTTDSDIDGATGETYRPLLAHLGQTIKVRVSFDDDNGSAESLTSAATAAVTASTYGQVIWSAKMTVGRNTFFAFITWGFSHDDSTGNLEPREFLYDGVVIPVSYLAHVTNSNTGEDVVSLVLDSGLGDGRFILYLDGEPFLIEEAGEQGTSITIDFEDHGISWSNNQEVEVRLTVNRPATGAPVITGKPEVGETLTADVSGIMDEDGAPAADQFAYQWISDDGTDDSDIDGATGSTYVLVDADGGLDVKVRVSFTDNANFPQSRTSDRVGPVLDTGVTVVPSTWSLVPSGLQAGDKFRLLFISSTTRMADPTNIATYNAWAQGLAASGHAEVQAFSSHFRVVGCTEVVDARDHTGTTYTSTDKGVGIYWLNGSRAANEYEDFYDGSWDEEASMRNESGTNVSAPDKVWTGCDKDGTEASQGGSTGSTALGRTFVEQGTPDTSGSSNGPISSGGAQGNSVVSLRMYALSGVFEVGVPTIEVPADWSLAPSGLQEGDQFRLLFISSAHRNASPSEIATYNTWVQDLAANGHTDIQDYSSSFRAVGSTEDMDARDNTGTTYTSSDKGVAIYWLGGNKVADDYEDFYDEDWDEEASMKNESGTAETGVSAWTGSDHDGTEMLQGTPETSRALGNSNNAWVRFGKTDSASHGPLSGATANRTGNKRIYGLSGVFEVVGGNTPATGTLTITGTAQVGGVLTANLSNVTDPDGLDDVSYSYQWIADDGTTETDIDHATGETYRPITADEDKTVKVRVSFTDDEGNPESLTSAATGAVSPWDKGELIWSALLTVGEYDTGAYIIFGFATGLAGSLEPPTFTFASTDITITTLAYTSPGSSLQLNAAIADRQALGSGAFRLYLDEAHWLFTNPADRPDIPITLSLRNLSWTDAQEVEVRLTVNHPATGAPVITGTPEVGETLTAGISGVMDEDGLPVAGQFAYNWISNDGTGDSDISGATGSTFTPQANHLGQTIKVRVSFTDNANFGESLTSDPVDPVGQDDWLWAATMTVGDANGSLGYRGNPAVGSLTSSPTFTHNSNSYEVESILLSSNGELRLGMDQDLPPDFQLHVGTDQFDKSDAIHTAGTGIYQWNSTGLSWSVGDTIPVWLAPVPSGPGVASVTVDQASITQTLADVTVTVANLQNASHTVYLRYRVEGGSWPAAANQSTPTSGAAVTFTLTGLTGNTEYDVAASLDSTFASGVKTASFTTSPTKPGKTRAVNVTFKGNGALAIGWDPPLNDGGSTITGYTVQWKSGNQSFGDSSREHTTGASASTYAITGLTNGTEYTVRVIAVNAVGDGPPSDTTTGTPVGPPDAPPNVQAGSGHQQLTVSWGAPNDGGSAITEYTLQWKSGGQSFISSRQRTIAGTSRTDTIPSLANGTEYTVRVRATTALGDSDWSAQAKGTPREGPHVSLVKVKEPISCTVTFVALEFVNLEAATEYQAHLRFRAQGSSSWTVLSPQGFWSSGLPSGAGRGELNGPSPAFTLTDLAYETAYEVQAALDSGFVDGLATTTFSTPNLSEVGLTPLSPGDGTLGLRMTRPTSEGRVDGYLLQWKSGDEEYDDTDTSERQADVPGSGDREYTITGLDNGVEYTVRAMAYNDNGVGVPSSEVRGTPEAPPNSPARGAPTISGTAQVGETLTADTDGIEDDDGLADAVYSYQWLADDADISGATGETYTPAYDDERKVIRVKVSFIDDRDFEETLTSEPTAAVEADPDAPTEPPNAPRTVRIVGDTNTSLTLTWDAPDGGTAVTEYRVQWLTQGEGFANARRDGREAVVDASARSHTIRGLTKYGFYQVRVLAVNGAGESERSNTAWGFPGLGEGQYGHG